MSMYGKYPKGVDGSEVKAWPVTDCTGDKGFTIQSDRDESDINKIVAKILKSGQAPPSLKGEPFYGDVSEFGDLQESYLKIKQAEDLFMSYPADVRERFDNNPVLMIDFLSDEGNRKEAEELGLVVPRPVVPAVVEPPAPLPAKPA